MWDRHVWDTATGSNPPSSVCEGVMCVSDYQGGSWTLKALSSNAYQWSNNMNDSIRVGPGQRTTINSISSMSFSVGMAQQSTGCPLRGTASSFTLVGRLSHRPWMVTLKAHKQFSRRPAVVNKSTTQGLLRFKQGASKNRMSMGCSLDTDRQILLTNARQLHYLCIWYISN